MNEEKKDAKGGTPIKLIVSLSLLLLLAALGFYSYLTYWGPNAWKYGYDEASTGIDDQGNPWIGAAEKPGLVIHEFMDYECPHCPTAHKRLRKALSSHLDEVRLVRHDYARMPCAPNSDERRRSSCALVRAGICAAKEGKFWQWNNAVIENPRPLVNPGRENYVKDTAALLELDFEKLDSCMFSEETVEAAQAIYRSAKKRKIVETPTYFVDDEKLELHEVFQIIDERL